MTQKRFLKLTAIAASVVLTIVALTAYRGGFAQKNGGQQQEVGRDTTQAPDSAALATGLNELQRIIDHYNTKSLTVSGEIRYYNTDSSTTTPVEKANFSFALNSGRTLYELDSVVTVTTEDLALVVDRRDETIAVIEKTEMTVESPDGSAPAAPADMLEMMKAFIKEAKVERQGQYNVLRLLFTEDAPSNVHEYAIVYDAATYAIKKIRMSITDAELANGLPDEDEQAGVTEDDELYFVDSANNTIPTGIYATSNLAVYEIIYLREKSLQGNTIDPGEYVKKQNDEYVAVDRYKNYSILN